MCSVSHVEEEKNVLVEDVHQLGLLGVRLKDSPNGGFMVHYNSDSSLVVEVKSKKNLYPLLMELKESSMGKINESFFQSGMLFLGTKRDYVYWMLRI